MIRTAPSTAAAALTASAVWIGGWVTITRAAKMLGYDRSTVWRGIQGGTIPAQRPSPTSSWRIPRQWVDAQIAAARAAVVRRKP